MTLIHISREGLQPHLLGLGLGLALGLANPNPNPNPNRNPNRNRNRNRNPNREPSPDQVTSSRPSLSPVPKLSVPLDSTSGCGRRGRKG